eukprot:414457-Karenia_brevis.AAC.1
MFAQQIGDLQSLWPVRVLHSISAGQHVHDLHGVLPFVGCHSLGEYVCYLLIGIEVPNCHALTVQHFFDGQEL